MKKFTERVRKPLYTTLPGYQTAAKQLNDEVNKRHAELPSAPVESAWKPGTGSRKRVRTPTPCCQCRQMLTVGDSFRLRRTGGGSLRMAHVRC